MSYETELANVNTLAYLFASIMSPSLQKTNVMLNHMYLEDVPQGTNKKRFKKAGVLVAEAATESTAYTFSASSELTDSYVEATAAMIANVAKRTEFLKRFGGEDGSVNRILFEQAKALARYIDNDAIGLFAGLSTTVTSTSVLTYDDLFLAQFNIFNSNCPDQNVPLSFVGAPRAFYNLRTEAHNKGAAAYSSPYMLGIFAQATPEPNGYMGEIAPGITGWKTTGFATTGGDNQQGLIHPQWCLAGIVDRMITVKGVEKISEGFYDEIGSLLFYDLVEWNDLCGVMVRSDT